MSRYMRGLFSQIIQGGTKAINYNKIKRTISPIEAAQRYGTVKHGFMRCPFHADRTPSLKLYGDHFHCFGCGAHGDVIDLTTALLGCSESEAARRLEADFGSGAFVPPRGLVECKREQSRCRDALAPKSPDDDIAGGYAEACTLDAWAGYLLDVGASQDETRLVEQKTARLMEGLRG